MLFGGDLADRYGARGAVSVGVRRHVSSARSAAGCWHRPTPPSWRGASLGGLGGGFAFAAGASYTRAIFATRGQHLAQGLYGASFLAGSASTLIYMPILAGAGGDWRRAYIISGLAAVAILAAWWRFAPAGPPSLGRAAGIGSGLVPALRGRNSWLLALCHMCGFGLAMVLGTWVVTYVDRGIRAVDRATPACWGPWSWCSESRAARVGASFSSAACRRSS